MVKTRGHKHKNAPVNDIFYDLVVRFVYIFHAVCVFEHCLIKLTIYINTKEVRDDSMFRRSSRQMPNYFQISWKTTFTHFCKNQLRIHLCIPLPQIFATSPPLACHLYSLTMPVILFLLYVDFPLLQPDKVTDQNEVDELSKRCNNVPTMPYPNVRI